MKVLWLSILVLSLSFAFAQLPPQVIQMPLPDNPEMVIGKLPNGLTYYIMQNAKPSNRVELRLFVNAGSVNEDDDQKGLAHFTEHMAFNGTKNFRKSEVVDYLSSIGMGFANGMNAMTSYDFTMYELKIPTDNLVQLNKGFQILSDMAYQVSFEPEELERERGVIIEEWRMGQNAQSRVSEKINKVIFAGSRYAERGVIGDFNVLNTFTRDKIVRFYNDWYRPDLQSVVVIGDLSTDDALALIKKYFEPIPAKTNPRPVQDYKVPDHTSPRAVVATDPEYPYSLIQASWKRDHEPFQTVGDFVANMHEELFFTMLNARLEELGQSPNPPFTFAYGQNSSMLKGISSTNLMAMTAEGKNLEALNILLTEAERVRQHGFLESEFARAKINLMRELEANLEEYSTKESRSLVWELFPTLSHQHKYMHPQQTLELAGSLMEVISLDAVNSVVDDLITEENLTISLMSTQKEGSVYPSEAQLLSVFGEVKASEIAAFEDNVSSEPLLTNLPTPGKILKKTDLKSSGIKVWKLSNGVTVYSKKTDFKADEVLFSAKSPGGYTKYNLAESRNAKFFGNYAASSGVGEFDYTALSKNMAGKIASVDLNVGAYYEGLSGSASPRDLETMFQLLYLKVTNPRYDENSLSSFVGRMKPYLENSLNNPQQIFFDSLSTLTYNNHPMMQSMKAQHLDDMKLNTITKIQKDRFADFSDFSFFFVGNFDEALLEEYTKQYLATLPTLKRKDKITDAGIRPFSGKKDIRFQKGANESSYVAHVTTGGIKLNDDNRVAMNSMLLVVNDKLRENIREELGGVYAIQAWQTYEQHPKPYYTVNIWMSCSPDRIDELNTAIFATIDSIRAGQFDEKYVVSSKAVMQKRYEESISQNRYWLNAMESNTFGKTPIDGFLAHPSRYAKIDKASITKAAKQYLIFDKTRMSLMMSPAPKE